MVKKFLHIHFKVNKKVMVMRFHGWGKKFNVDGPVRSGMFVNMYHHGIIKAKKKKSLLENN